MIIKIRVEDVSEIKRVLVNGKRFNYHGFYPAEILEMTELTEKEKLLSKILGNDGLSQNTKETLTQIVNKVYEK